MQSVVGIHLMAWPKILEKKIKKVKTKDST